MREWLCGFGYRDDHIIGIEADFVVEIADFNARDNWVRVYGVGQWFHDEGENQREEGAALAGSIVRKGSDGMPEVITLVLGEEFSVIIA